MTSRNCKATTTERENARSEKAQIPDNKWRRSSIRKASSHRRNLSALLLLAALPFAGYSFNNHVTAESVAASTDAATGQPSTSASPSGTLTFSLPTLPTSLDPHLQFSGLPGLLWTGPLYDSLLYLSSDNQLEADLATEWQLGQDSDGPYLDLALREGLTFPDGAPFNSETVAASIQRAQTLPGSLAKSDVADVTVEQLSEIAVRLHSPNAVALPALLAGPAGIMISQQAIADDVDLTKTPAGIGMYLLDEFSPPQVSYTANQDYWNLDVVKIANLVVIGSGDDNARLNLMRTGDLDITYLNPALDSAAEGLGYEAVDAPLLGSYGYAVNTSEKPFDDIRVRQALSMAIDRDSICQVVFFGECTPTNQLYPTGSPAFDPTVPPTNYDTEGARALLEAASAVGTHFTLINIGGVPKFATLAAAIQAQWNAAGFDVEILDMPVTQIATEFGENAAAPIAFVSYGAFADPSQAVTTYLDPSSLLNPGEFVDPEVQRLANMASGEADTATRNSLFQQISALTATDLSHIIIMTPSIRYWVRSTVSGFSPPLHPANQVWRNLTISS